MNPKKAIDWVKDTNKPLHERTFVLMSGLAFSSLLGIFVWDIFIGESLLKLTVLGLALVGFVFVLIAAIHFNIVQACAILMSLGITFVVLPFEFFTGGGVYGCTPIWFAFSIMYVGINVQGRMKYVMIAAVSASAIGCYVLSYRYPALLTEHDMKTAYLDSIASLLGVGFLLFASLWYLAQLYKRENDLAEEQKLEIEELNRAQNRFFSSMSHEIRTPINTIIGLNEMIMREESISDEVADNARNIRAASKMLLTTINDILDISKIESGRMDIVPVEYDLGNMLSDIVGMTWLRAKEKNLEFHVDVDKECPTKFYGDEVRIKQILINVLTNAVKYTQKGSVTLSIHCRRLEGSKALMIYSVADTGMGIKKESMPYLFTAFKRVDEDKNRYIEGTGLGLSIVKQFVELMGGVISVNSVYTKGSTFLIELPQEVLDDHAIGELNLEARHALSQREHYKQSFEAPKAHVLVVDDNETNLLVATKLLRDTRVNVETATSGKEALEKTLRTHYDTIFMDHLMPEMDGIECLKQIRAQVGGLNPETPIVALTANAGSENQALYSREGFDGYLLKPVSGRQLEGELMAHLPRELVHVTGQVEMDGSGGLSVDRHTAKIPVMITTESVCDLPKSVIDRKEIQIIPHRIQTEKGWFMDGEEIEADGLLAYMEEGGMATSEPPEVAEFEAFFAEQLTKATHIIHLSLAEHVSSAYANAVEAAKTFDNVTVLDSGQLTSGLGFLVLYALRRAGEDATVETIVEELEQMKPRVHTSFIVTTTEYLERVGRINHRVHELSRTLMLHPVIMMKKSAMTVGGLKFGTKSFVWKSYIHSTLDTLEPIDEDTLFITYVGMSNDELQMVAEEVAKKRTFQKVIIQKASPTISTNCGPGTFGLIYMTKEKK